VRNQIVVPVRLGLRENAGQFTLLVFINALVGAMAGLERSILPTIAEQDFQIAARAGVLSFILVFGLAKALANLAVGALADRRGRKTLLVAGWVVALPVPLLLMWAPAWKWILVANVLLGVSQGLTWSMTVLMKVDLAGPKQRGLAMGLNEFAGYLSVAGAAFATAWLAATFGLRPVPFLIGVLFVIAGLVTSILLVSDTTAHVTLESANPSSRATPSARSAFWLTTFRDRELSSMTQAGLVNNLNDAMAWGLFPLIFERAGGSRDDRMADRALSGDMGADAARRRRLVRSPRPAPVHRLGHGDAGDRHRGRRVDGERGRIRGRHDSDGPRHRGCLPHAPGRHRRRRGCVVARRRDGHLPVLARHGLRGRRGGGGARRGSARLQGRAVDGGRDHRGVRGLGGPAHA
jgi:hypothetical protein